MNKKVFITGGAGGLGTAIATSHLSLGDIVWAIDLKSSPRLDELLNQYSGLNFMSCDISNTQSVQAALKNVFSQDDCIDYIYSCAGIYNFDDKVELPKTDLDKAAYMYDINAVGFLRVIKELLPSIKDNTAILCITSEAGSIAENRRSNEFNYCMSKAAENMACVILQSYFDELKQNTRIICLHPGWLRTKMGGPDALKLMQYSVDPSDSANAIVDIALDIDNIPKENMFMDYKRKLIKW